MRWNVCLDMDFFSGYKYLCECNTINVILEAKYFAMWKVTHASYRSTSLLKKLTSSAVQMGFFGQKMYRVCLLEKVMFGQKMHVLVSLTVECVNSVKICNCSCNSCSFSGFSEKGFEGLVYFGLFLRTARGTEASSLFLFHESRWHWSQSSNW